MDENQNQDVNQADATTASASSDTEQTTSTDASANTTAQTTEGDQKTVPYERFSEINEKYRATEETVSQVKQELEQLKAASQARATNGQAQDPAIEAQKTQAKQVLGTLLNEMGYVSRDELTRQEQDRQLDTTLKSLETKYDGSNGLPKFSRRDVVKYAVENGFGNPEKAFEDMNKQAFINHYVQQAIAKSKGIQTEGSNGTGSQNVGTTNDDLKAAIAKGDRSALHTLLKRSIPKK